MTKRTLQDLLDDDTIDTMSITDPPVAEILSTGGDDGWTQLSFGDGRAPGSSPYWLVGEPAAGRTTLLHALLSTIDDEVQGGEPR